MTLEEVLDRLESIPRFDIETYIRDDGDDYRWVETELNPYSDGDYTLAIRIDNLIEEIKRCLKST